MIEAGRIQLLMDQSQESASSRSDASPSTPDGRVPGTRRESSADMVEQLQVALDTVCSLRAQLAGSESRYSSEIFKLKESLKLQNDLMEDVNARESVFSEVKKQLHAKMASSQEDLRNKDVELASLREGMEMMAVDRTELENTISKLESENENLTNSLKREVECRKTDRLKSSEELKNVQQNLTRVSKDLADAEILTASQNMELSHLRTDLANARTETDTVRRDLAALRGKRDTLRKHKKQLGKEVMSLRDVSSKHEKAVSESQLKISQLESRLSDLSTKFSESEKRNSELIQHSRERTELQRELFDLQRTMEQRESRLEHVCSMSESLSQTLCNISIPKLKDTLCAPSTTALERVKLSNQCILEVVAQVRSLADGPLRYTDEQLTRSLSSSTLSSTHSGTSPVVHPMDPTESLELKSPDSDTLVQAVGDQMCNALLSNARLQLRLNTVIQRVLEEASKKHRRRSGRY